MQANGMICRGLVAVATLATATVGSAVGTAGAEEGSAAVAAAHIDIAPHAKELQRDAIRLFFSVTCPSGAAVQELELGSVQGEFTHTETASSATGITCDGVAHHFQWQGPEAFSPGAVHVTARLTVVDTSTGDPLPQAADEQRVWIKPAAKAAIWSPAKLLADGDALLKVSYTCDQPWIEPDMSIELRQDGGTVGGGSFVNETLRCDDRWHVEWVRISPSELPFHPGAAEATVFVSVSAPETFDPVAQAQLTRIVRIAR